MPELALFAQITPKPANRAEALAAVRAIVSETRSESGCLRFELNEGEPGDPSFYLVERWTDDAALEAHYAEPYVREIFAAYEDWLDAPVRSFRMRPLA